MIKLKDSHIEDWYHTNYWVCEWGGGGGVVVEVEGVVVLEDCAVKRGGWPSFLGQPLPLPELPLLAISESNIAYIKVNTQRLKTLHIYNSICKN